MIGVTDRGETAHRSLRGGTPCFSKCYTFL